MNSTRSALVLGMLTLATMLPFASLTHASGDLDVTPSRLWTGADDGVWEEITPPPPLPPSRFGHQALYDLSLIHI